MSRVGVDLGGSFIKVGRVEQGRVVRRAEGGTRHDFARCMDDVAALVSEVAPQGFDAPLGLGLPGVIERSGQSVLDAPNLPFLERQPVADALAQRLGVAVQIENDANVAALGEARHGAGRGHPDFLLATLGTGIGGGLILDGKLYRGPGGMAGEFGHLFVGHERRCGCGARGCLEAAVSARHLLQWAQEEGIRADGLQDLAGLARRNDKAALSLFRRAGALLGEACAAVALLLDLRVFLLGGGGSPVTDLLAPSALQVLGTRAFGRAAADFRILPAALGNDAGIIGAAELA
ncbi:MAG: ROK family protein [Planctomycetota bacterium]|nr:MAG: ROK family protein [Planctomycetota bacterium]